MSRVSPWVVVLLLFFLFFTVCMPVFPFSSEDVVFILLVFDFISLTCDQSFTRYSSNVWKNDPTPTNAWPPKPKDLFSSHL